MSFVMGVVMSIAMTILNGAPFILPVLLMQILIATIVGVVVMLALPGGLFLGRLASGDKMPAPPAEH